MEINLIDKKYFIRKDPRPLDTKKANGEADTEKN